MNSIQAYGNELWEKAIVNLKSETKSQNIHFWLDNLSFVRYCDDSIEVMAKDEFTRDWFINNYFLKVKKEISSLDDKAIKLSIVTSSQEVSGDVVAHSTFNVELFSSLNPKNDFENFVIGHENKRAFEEIKKIADTKFINSGNVFCLYSKVGMGKTHLMQSLGNEIIKKDIKKKFGYLTAEKFMYTFVDAVKKNGLFEFRKAISDVDLFLIDDIQFICGKESTQREFSLLLNMFIEAGKTIVIASNTLPKDLELRDEKIKSLLVSANLLFIERPKNELRLEILRHYNAMFDYEISQEILEFFASKITNNVRELEASLKNFVTYLNMVRGKPSVLSASSYIKEYLRTHVEVVTTTAILDAVAKFYKISKESILSSRRTSKVVLARQISAFLSKELTSDSLHLIGQKIGNRNHSTVIYYINKIKMLLKDNAEFQQDVDCIKNYVTQ